MGAAENGHCLAAGFKIAGLPVGAGYMSNDGFAFKQQGKVSCDQILPAVSDENPEGMGCDKLPKDGFVVFAEMLGDVHFPNSSENRKGGPGGVADARSWIRYLSSQARGLSADQGRPGQTRGSVPLWMLQPLER